MGILDENVYEKMRLILPEHRSFMERAEREAKKRTKPQLSQQKWDEMSYAITEAMELQKEIRFILFDPYEDEIWTGLPEMYAGALHVWIDDERRRVPMDRLIYVYSV